MNIVIIGTQWGDEGKGKIIDILSAKTDYIVRYQGGSNAGHTVVVGNQEHIFHVIPSGILHKGKICCIGNGVVIDPAGLLKEIEGLGSSGVSVGTRLKISNLAHVILPYHKILDQLREGKRTHKIGTTGRGIGPCYSDKINRCGIRMVDLLNPRVFREKLRDNLKEKNEIFSKVYHHPVFSFENIYREYLTYGRKLAPYTADTHRLIQEAIKAKKDILFEGAQGAFLDIDFGTYPFVTSSSASAAGACVGSGVSPLVIDKIVGVAKAYTTRVGEGPFPTELAPVSNKFLREKGREFGATTGRPRRCGWFDAVAVREAVLLNGISELAIMKMDILSNFKTIKVCTGYAYKGKVFKEFPYDSEVLSNIKPVYKDLPGWQLLSAWPKSYKNFPKNARDYLTFLQDMLGVRISMISVGSSREETVTI